MKKWNNTFSVVVVCLIFGILVYSCGESPYVGLAKKSAEVDSLIIKARAAGKTNMDSLRKAKQQLAEKYVSGIDPNKVKANDLYYAAKLFYTAGKTDTALQLLLKVQDNEAYQLLFNIYLQTDRVKQAEDLFRQEMKALAGEELGELYEALYSTYQERGEVDDALRLVEEAIANLPADEILSFQLAKAELLYEKGNQAEALALLEQLKKAHGEDARAMRGINAKLTLYRLIGKQAPELIVQQWIESEPLKIRALRGKVVFLDFFGPWCGPCRAMFPHIKKLYEEYHDRGLVIIGVTRYYGFFNQLGQNLRDLPPEEELEWIKKFKWHHQIPFAYAVADMASGRKNEEAYGVYGIPHMVVIDQKGLVREVAIGSGKASEEKLDRIIADLFRS